MNLEQQVVSLELAKKLKELGVKQDSIFFYTLGGVVSRLEALDIFDTNYAAFTVAELGIMLPATCYYSKYTGGRSGSRVEGWKSSVMINEDEIHSEYDKNEADARAKMLIHLIENKMVNVDDK